MSWSGLAMFAGVYFIAVATPGPAVAAVVAQGLARGFSGAGPFILGFVAGDLTWFAAAALGLGALARALPVAFIALKFAGAAYLLYVALSLWRAPVDATRIGASASAATRPRDLFLGSYALTLGNPKPMVFFLALLPSVVPLERLDWSGGLAIGAVIALVLPATLGAYGVLAVRSRSLLRDPRALRRLNRTGGVLLAVAAVAVATH